LARDARAGVPIIGIEPSSVSVFRDELTDLLPHDMDARRVRDSFRLLSEFLAEEGVELPRLGGRAVLHNHCHHKAVLNAGATLTVLGKMGIEAEEPEPGCCGLA